VERREWKSAGKPVDVGRWYYPNTLEEVPEQSLEGFLAEKDLKKWRRDKARKQVRMEDTWEARLESRTKAMRKATWVFAFLLLMWIGVSPETTLTNAADGFLFLTLLVGVVWGITAVRDRFFS
jgi:hypothetical protein